MGKALNAQGRLAMFPRLRPRTIFFLVLAALTTYFLVFSGPSPRLRIVPHKHDSLAGEDGAHGQHHNPPNPSEPQKPAEPAGAEDSKGSIAQNDPGHHHDEPTGSRPVWEVSIEDVADWADPVYKEADDLLPGHESDGTFREPGDVARLQHEKDLRKMWRWAYDTAAEFGSSNLIFGNTLKQLHSQDRRTEALQKKLRVDSSVHIDLIEEQPVRFNPYPSYNSEEWKKAGHAPYVACAGPTGDAIEDALVYRGRPGKWPEPKFGSYDLFGIDPNLCWERDTRLGPHGLLEVKKKAGGSVNWDKVNWGDLQKQCLKQNALRFEMTRDRKNPFLNNYAETQQPAPSKQEATDQGEPSAEKKADAPKIKARSAVEDGKGGQEAKMTKESRTAVLLRSYTGKTFTDNDRQVIRAMISELSLKSGGQYEVFLLVHCKDENRHIFENDGEYQAVLNEAVPAEFHGITVLWNDKQVFDIYPDKFARDVHNAQWLSVQKFSHDHPEFEFIWNWEMDFRYTGHHYDLLEGVASFAKKQPRKYLWERNERYYIPSIHGDYDTAFRQSVAKAHGNETIWTPPAVPFVKPVGPKPPTSLEEDHYKWGVGENADVITVGPMFNPVDSQWIIGNSVWGYTDADHKPTDLPRRSTIVTHSRVSKRLLDIMHVENMRGNHVASEMTPQTVALLHGFKAVFAPHPVFMDRDWKGGFLQNWFNPGPRGESGGRGSPSGWGRERRYQGTTWYYRAEPPNRLYNNWMGWVDTEMGGQAWEEQNGRPCLPSVMLHPIKSSTPTSPDHKTQLDLFMG
ncbi:hypothetical protein E4U42_000618 [Claviceps africana]|uniref:Major facilitator superfamily transporter n=1 Tax=Claviceps africana TaxID=83212 RepID=A0A8K0J0F9_9HYPO|nr:hypothetical protein E4U42_000618 [Claviceps africana]